MDLGRYSQLAEEMALKCFHTCVVLIIIGVSCNCFFDTTATYQTKEAKCTDSGLVLPGGTTVFIPENCRPTECAATFRGPHRGSTHGFQCSVGNYINNDQNACVNIKNTLQSQALQSDRQFDDVCQAKLTSVSLYVLYCKNIEYREVSLSFTFQLPTCGMKIASPLDVVIVNFSAKNESMHPFFATNPICRSFNYSGSDFSQLTRDDVVEISYDCMGIGLQGKVSEVHYYLSFTSFPSGAYVNYTLVYMDAGPKSMELVAAAWLSTSRVHVVFQPISGITRYRVLADSEQSQWSFSEEVSSHPAVEITDIPLEAIIITVQVIAVGCQLCEPITVKLHDRRTIYPPLEPDSNSVWPTWASVLIVIALLVSLLTAGIIRKAIVDRRELTGDDVPVLCIANPSKQAQNLQKSLKKYGFMLTDALQEKITKASSMKDYSFIIVCIHPSLPNCRHWADILQVIKEIFENRPLWVKTRIVSFRKEGEKHSKPSEILHGHYDQCHWEEFLKHLDRNTFSLHQDMHKLIKDFKKDGGIKTLSDRFSQCNSHKQESTVELVSKTANTRYARRETNACQNGFGAGGVYNSVSYKAIPNTEEHPENQNIGCHQFGDEAPVHSPTSNMQLGKVSCAGVPVAAQHAVTIHADVHCPLLGPHAVGNPGPHAVGNPGPHAVVNSGPHAVGNPGPHAVVNPGPRAVGNPGPHAVGNPGQHAVVNPGPHAVGNPGPHAVVNPGPHAVVNPGPRAVGNPGPHAVGNPGQHAVVNPGPHAVGNPGLHAVGNPGPRAVVNPGPHAVGNPGPHAVGNPGPHAVVNPGLHAVGNPGPHAVGNPGPHAVGNPGPHAVGNPGPHAVVNPGPHAVGNPGPHAVGNPGPHAVVNPGLHAVGNPGLHAVGNPGPHAVVNPGLPAAVNPEPPAIVNPGTPDWLYNRRKPEAVEHTWMPHTSNTSDP